MMSRCKYGTGGARVVPEMARSKDRTRDAVFYGAAPATADRTRDKGPSSGTSMLTRGAAVCWRLLVVGVTAYALVWVLGRFAIVVIPVFVALFFTAMLHAPVTYLRNHGWPRMAATWVVLVAAVAVITAVGYFVVLHVTGQYPHLVNQVSVVRDQLQQMLRKLPGGGSTSVNQLSDRVVTWLQQHRSSVAGGVMTAGRVVLEVVTGAVIAFFLTYFFLADGDRIWSWIVRLLSPSVRPSVNGAGHRAFRVLSGWVVGTAAIACVHGTVIGLVMWRLGTPLVIPLAVLIFVGSFIPMIGAVLFGGLALLVTLVAVGPVSALVLLVVLVMENQLEAHLMQPFIVGRAVRLHPVTIVLVLTAAGAVGGFIGAIVAVPLVAAMHAAVKYLTGVEDLHGHPIQETDRMEPITPPESAPLPFLSRGRRAPVPSQQATRRQQASE